VSPFVASVDAGRQSCWEKVALVPTEGAVDHFLSAAAAAGVAVVLCNGVVRDD
jgi:hypothetical protein